jgi:hypothetical protein
MCISGNVVRRLGLGLLTAAALCGAASAQDTGIMAALLGQCTYRDAVVQAQLRDAREMATALSAYWTAWVAGETEKKLGAAEPRMPATTGDAR